MKSDWIFIKCLLIVVIACSFIVSCEDSSGPYDSYFHMKVDSISVPVEIMQTDTLEVVFYATLPSCCHNFHQFDARGDLKHLNIRLIGKLRHNTACCAAIKYIEETYRVSELLTGYFYIEVIQPDNSSIIDSVLVFR